MRWETCQFFEGLRVLAFVFPCHRGERFVLLSSADNVVLIMVTWTERGQGVGWVYGAWIDVPFGLVGLEFVISVGGGEVFYGVFWGRGEVDHGGFDCRDQ